MAQIRLEQAAERVNVYCKVLIQEAATEAHRLFARELSTYDAPTDTPIDREAATTLRQNTVWATIRRDKSAEREILAAVLDRAGVAKRSTPNESIH